MRAITKTEIKTALDEVGITNGQTIMVHSDLTRIGWVDNAKSRVDILEFYFKSIINQKFAKQDLGMVLHFGNYMKQTLKYYVSV